MDALVMRELVAADWRALRDLRLHALRTEPGVFFSSYEAEAGHPDAQWLALASGDEQHQLFGLFDGDRLVGMTAVFVDRDDPSGRSAALGMSYISPEYRGRGFAAMFYEARLAWARDHPHFARAVVGHRRSNVASRRMIERFGFRWTRDKPHHWPDGTDEDHVGYELQFYADGSPSAG
jgi:RimJ/RimL family protein N-acetyltransferase